MKLLFFGACLCLALIEANALAEEHQEENGNFVNELTVVALKAIESFANYGHRLIEVEEIGNISRTLDQNIIKVVACRFNDINQRTEIHNHPENNVTINDFFVCDVCTIKINSTENNTYSAVEMGCVLHDSRIYGHSPEVVLS